MPTVRDLWAASSAKGGMELKIEFEYDENVTVVMAAFRERTKTPHASMPLVHRVDVLRERISDPETEPNGWSTRKRRFFTHNDAPEWVRKLSGGEYLVGIERIEWNENQGAMRMYTVNESHANKIVAEELCVISKHPQFPESKTVKTLTVRARLCIRGWWTLGISHVCEKFLLGSYDKLVQQGKRIELEEITRWRQSGRAEKLLRDAFVQAEARKTKALEASDSPVSPLFTGRNRETSVQDRSTTSVPGTTTSVDGLEVETLEQFERLMVSEFSESEYDSVSAVGTLGMTPVTPRRTPDTRTPGTRDSNNSSIGPDEDQWLVMRYEDGFKTPVSKNRFDDLNKSTAPPSASPQFPGNPVEWADNESSPLYVPIEEVEEVEQSDYQSNESDSNTLGNDFFSEAVVSSPASPILVSDPEDESLKKLGTPGAAARLFLSPATASDERRVRLAHRQASRKKNLAKDLAFRDEEEAFAKKMGLETEKERFTRVSLGFRRVMTRVAVVCAMAGIMHERRESLKPLSQKLKSFAVSAKRRAGLWRAKKLKKVTSVKKEVVSLETSLSEPLDGASVEVSEGGEVKATIAVSGA